MKWSAGPRPVAMLAAATGVTEGNADTQSRTYVPRCMIFASTGAWPWSTARSSISGLSASTTARTSFLRFGCRSALTASTQAAQALVLLGALAARSHDQHGEGRERDEGERREEDREPGEREGDAVGVRVEESDRAAGVPHAPARPREQRGEREPAERGAGHPGDDAGPALVALVGQRAGEQQRAEHGAEGEQGAVEQLGLPAPAECVRGHRKHKHDQQEPGRLEEAEVGAVEVEARVPARQSARQKGRQKWADATRSGEPRALSDVHEEAHCSDSMRRLASRGRPRRAPAVGKATSLRKADDDRRRIPAHGGWALHDTRPRALRGALRR